MKKEQYYVGLDIGTDSVGYAVTDESYNLCRFKGEDIWGTHIFDEAQLNQDRRSYRTARRRLDRRQQRVLFIQEIFAKEIVKVDPAFYQRIRESALWREDAKEPTSIFNDPHYKDIDYHREYPTIHHLILSLMNEKKIFDVRLVYLACAWLVAHRGHFLMEVDKTKADEVRDFGKVYRGLMDYLRENCEETPWNDPDMEKLANLLKGKGIQRKKKEITALLLNGSKPTKAFKTASKSFPFSREAIVALISGGKNVKLSTLLGKEEFDNLAMPEVSLDMDDEKFDDVLTSIGNEAELLRRLKAIYDWTVLSDILNGHAYISEAKVEIYDRHRQDLANLKYLIRTYQPGKYNSVFRNIEADNYVAYSGNAKFAKNKDNTIVLKRSNQENFLKSLKKIVAAMKPAEKDAELHKRVLSAIEDGTFLPKQVNTDNRVIPYQLYWAELNKLLQNVSSALPFLKEQDEDGLTPAQKILSVFSFRIPYYVGPLNANSKNSHAWLERKAGRITPWNFDSMVDLNASEQGFINRMIGQCTYLPGEKVLPKASLAYCRFVVLNEINNLKINGKKIDVKAKQSIFTDLFERRKKVTRKALTEFMISNGICSKEEAASLSGIDNDIHGSLVSFVDFRGFISHGKLLENDIEQIIERSTCTEDRSRLRRWLKAQFPTLEEKEIKYIAALKYKDFGKLSAAFLKLQGADRETGEVMSVTDALWNTNNNLMELLSDRFTFSEEIDRIRREYYACNKKKLSERLDDMYVSNAVKRPIIRSLDILRDVVKVQGHAPAKIFVEMARGASENQKNKRTKTRRQQLLELFESIGEDAKALKEELESMQEADNRLQSEKLYLYYLQLGRCMYTGQAIDLNHLTDGTYNIEHIYPQSKVKDDSIFNNEVLVLSEINGQKSDDYPIDPDIRKKMYSFWLQLKNHGLITEEKFRRLTRSTSFSTDEKWEFIARQLVETRQSTKVIAALLKEYYPETEIVYVKAGLVSNFRQEFELMKSRQVNDLHHAKDAYLNIVVGNVYHEKFTRAWFLKNTEQYSINIGPLFGNCVKVGERTIWEGSKSLEAVKKVVHKNSPHYTRYAFCRTGGYFDQMPIAAAEGLIPRKAGMPTEKYGGYNKPAASFFVAVKYTSQKKQDVIIMPVELLVADRFRTDDAFAQEYSARTISGIIGKTVNGVSFPMQGRILKINTVFEFDGFRMCLSGKSGGGSQIIMSTQEVLHVDAQTERYVKRLESFAEKKKTHPNLACSPTYDKITKEENLALYDMLCSKLLVWPYCKRPGNPADTMVKGRNLFESSSVEEQISLLLTFVGLFNRISGGRDLTLVGGAKKGGASFPSSSVSSMKKNYLDVRIIDVSASGMYERKSENILTWL